MKKLLKVLVVLVVLAVVAVVGLYLSRNMIATSVGRSAASSVLGVPVQIGAVELNLFEASAVVRDLDVGNPTGYAAPSAIKAGTIEVTLSAETTPQRIVVERVQLDNLGVWFIQKGMGNNITDILNNMPGAPSGNTKPSGPTVEVVIKKLVLNNVEANISEPTGLLSAAPVKIAHLEVDNISTKSAGEGLMQQLTTNIVQASMGAVVGNLGGALPASIGNSINGSLQGAGAVMGKATEAIGGAVKDATKGATDALKGLGDALGGKK